MIIVYTLYIFALILFVGINLKFARPKWCALAWTMAMVALGYFYDAPYVEFLLSALAFPAFLLFSPQVFFFISATYEYKLGSTLVLGATVFFMAWVWFFIMLRYKNKLSFLIPLILFPPLALVFWIPLLYSRSRDTRSTQEIAQDPSTPLQAEFDKVGQGHVFSKWNKLSKNQKALLVKQAGSIRLDEIQRLVAMYRSQNHAQGKTELGNIKPPKYIPHRATWKDESDWLKVLELGEEAIRGGRVGLFTVAGGQGTRLGVDSPKGLFPVTPVKNKTLFHVFAEKIKAAELRYEQSFHWFIMTSPMGHTETVNYFKANDYFGLEHVHIIQQGCMPAVDMDGKLLMEKPHSLAMSPDGHGGALRAIVRNGCTEIMKKHGIDMLSYFQVDNPMVDVMDPFFIGFHCREKSEMSSKMVTKRDASEKVGLFCELPDGHVSVVEYSDLPVELNDAKDASDQLKFRCANLGIHILDRQFIERVGREDSPMPFHFAQKKVPYENANGDWIEPEKPNAIKFEMFIFDALKEAKNPVLLETLREEEFSPVKNAKGPDSPEECKRNQQLLFAKWFEDAGVDLEKDSEGCPRVPIEVSPLFATNEEEFIVSWDALEEKPDLKQPLYLE